MTNSESISLGEAATRFLAKLAPDERESSQPEVHRFVRWYGSERPISQLSAPEAANYAERLSLSDTDYARRLELIKAFLVFARKSGWTGTNLSVHLKAKKTRPGLPAGKSRVPETVPMTRQGYEELKAELAGLKNKRPQLIEEIRKAAADKDFRENAPLHAAREQFGHLEGRIIGLEETLKAAVIISEEPTSTVKAGIGDSLVLQDLSSGEELRYKIVTPREVDPAQGKISSVSPIGKALIGHGEGETVEVTVPAGKLRYRITRVER